MTGKACKGRGNNKIRERRNGFGDAKTVNVVKSITVTKNISPGKGEKGRKIIIL